MTDLVAATDAILGAFRTQWLADTPAITGTTAPAIVYEETESDLKPHPRDGTKAWARIVIRHSDGGGKATLANADGLGRYRRTGIVWVQIFVPAADAKAYTIAQQLAQVARNAYEGKRAAGRDVVFYKVTAFERPKDGSFLLYDVKTTFSWDEVKR